MALLLIHCTTIPSTHVRILVLPVTVWVLGLGTGLGFVQVRLVSFLLVFVDDEDGACIDGTVTDVIHSASNSVIQGFSEYHDDSCTRLDARLNSRVGRGHDGRVETKLLSTSTLCKVRLPADKKVCSLSAGVGKGA